MRKTSIESIYKLAKKNKRVIFIGSDLGPNILSEMKKNFPERFFMEGVSEQHIIGMAAGLALEGFLPFVNTISTFLTRRCYEQILIDLCLQNLPVKLIASGGGLVYAPLGPTHISLEDISILRVLPNISIICPCDSFEMQKVMDKCLESSCPMYIRLAKGGDKVVSKKFRFNYGKASLYKKSERIMILSTGVTTQIACETIEELHKLGIDCGGMHFHCIKPLDKSSLKKILKVSKKIITIEEHYVNGGFGSMVLEYCNEFMPSQSNKILRIGIPNLFTKNYGSQQEIMKKYGLSSKNLIKKIKEINKCL